MLLGKTSREEGIAHLDDLGLSRAGLEKLARALDLPVGRSDRVDRLKERIVEATIGYRLRSGAIKGEVATTGGIGPKAAESSAPSVAPEVPEGHGATEVHMGTGSPVVDGLNRHHARPEAGGAGGERLHVERGVGGTGDPVAVQHVPAADDEPGLDHAEPLATAGVKDDPDGGEPAGPEDAPVDPRPNPGGERVPSADRTDPPGAKRLTW